MMYFLWFELISIQFNFIFNWKCSYVVFSTKKLQQNTTTFRQCFKVIFANQHFQISSGMIGTTYVNKVYEEKYGKFIYHHWIQQSIPRIIRSSNRFGFHKIQHIAIQHNIRFTPMAWTSIANINLVWNDLEIFYDIICFVKVLQSQALLKYPNLTIF
jgi:hypothetical protein